MLKGLRRAVLIYCIRAGLTGFPDVEGIETFMGQDEWQDGSLTGFPDVEGIETFPRRRILRCWVGLTGFPDVEGIETSLSHLSGTCLRV